MPDQRMSRRDLLGAGAVGLGAASLAGRLAEAASDRPLKVRFGLNLLVYTATFDKGKIDLVAKVADMGYDGVEIPFNDLGILDAKATRRACAKAGVGLTSCCVLLPGTSLIGTQAAERRAGVERVKRMIDITAEMGGDTVAGPIYAPVRELTGRARTADEWKWGGEGLRAAAEHADVAKVNLAIEPLNRFETHFLNTAADAIRLVKAVGHPRLKVQLDTFHANIEEKDTAAAVRACGANLGHFHASESDRGIPGTGQVHWAETFAALSRIGYARWITVESFATGIVDLCAAACIWRPLYGSADELATQSLAFLKRMAGAA